MKNKRAVLNFHKAAKLISRDEARGGCFWEGYCCLRYVWCLQIGDVEENAYSMKTLEQVKQFVLANLYTAGINSHITQRDYLRIVYRGVKSANTIYNIILILELGELVAPYEAPINSNWPNQKYCLGAIKRETRAFVDGFPYCNFTGLPFIGGLSLYATGTT